MSGSTTTIAAIASPPGGGARGILRLSGSRAREIVLATWAGALPLDLSTRGVHVGRFRDGRGEQPLLLLWMPAPRSFTRDDVAEFHLPGSPPLLAAALARLLELGAVAAAPGEFTRRAFLSGRIDLSRAEGVLALVTARTESERRAGLALLAGGLAARIDRVRDRVEGLRALVEASLDFDTRDTGHVPDEEIESRAVDVAAALAEAAAWEIARAGDRGEPRIVLSGAPNAGKSALFNRLAGSEGAIVSPAAGTTRDVLSVELDLGGLACRLFDTAGIDDAATPDSIEHAAQELGRASREAADLHAWVLDASAPFAESDFPPEAASGSRVLVVWNKVDLAGTPREPPAAVRAGRDWVATSAVSGEGIGALREALARALRGPGTGSSRELALRHRVALERAVATLQRGLASWKAGAPLEIFAQELRAATEALDEITGATTAEAVLDRIFARFCLGK
ncbi:MAG TPA: tRNA modification GTPase [Planctomycetota bacterium]|jgi:tRNA modification GTPase|nr:tRNA modification GTPase [Planctomycetota bacterium]